MSQNLISVPEDDEEQQGDYGAAASRESEPKRVSFSHLTSGTMPPSASPTLGYGSSGSLSTSSTRARPLRTLGTAISEFLPSFRSNNSRGDSVDTFGRESDDSSRRTPLNNKSLSSVAARLGRLSSGIDTPTQRSDNSAPRVYRRYRVGDPVLVSNHQSRFANLVNRYGYPPGEGITPEEQRGPYVYILATVKKVHFEEDAEYYTVTRVDTGVDQRADDEYMEPIRTARGEAAARAAATAHASLATEEGDADQAAETTALKPFKWVYRGFKKVVVRRLIQCCAAGKRVLQKQGRLFLNGMSPYSFSRRITAVNILVLCSTWYILVDQMRLAFFPPNADHAIAITNFIVWLLLVVELVCEVFIRPEGYRNLIVSEKAYAPSTVRYINAFHLFGESLSLAIFFPEFMCLFSEGFSCGDRKRFSYFNAAFMAVLGPLRLNAFYGRFYVAAIRLRVIGMVRHWKKMWINNTFVTMRSVSIAGLFVPESAPNEKPGKKDSMEQKEKALINASNIGTALMVTNSHRAIVILWLIMGLLPIISTIRVNGSTNTISTEMVEQLQAINVMTTQADDPDECRFLVNSLISWVVGVTSGHEEATNWGSKTVARKNALYLLYLWVEPARCTGETEIDADGMVVTSLICEDYYYSAEIQDNLTEEERDGVKSLCSIWANATENTAVEEMASRARIRTGSIQVNGASEIGNLTLADGTQQQRTFAVKAMFNQTISIQAAAFSSFLLQLCLLICVLGGLSVLRRDATVLVLGPLRRMLKIVARYAKNPLAPATANKGDNDSDDESETDAGSPEDRLGNFETEQLINAITKIADLLRKCWGVAGAGIISTNLATQEGALTEVFNPTVPGKSVYALFGFAAIKGFDHALHNLGGDVMILINDVAAVLHDEVFRWGFGDSGQCNKNLGSAFLMVYRIGLVKEVIQKLEQATDVVFAGSSAIQKGGVRRRKKSRQTTRGGSSRRASAVSTNAMSLSLQSLPGISTFTDRAVIGMLKSYAGIYRDNKLLAWRNDFRLGAGVGAFTVNMIFGMDAGWAQEGAVGSEYKIDATYLSPHVNMASRMMSACKQYGVSILLSQAVQELMSSTARSKLRHLDTVTVKGSSLQQKIFTYDARHKGVDFFLFSRSDAQADSDADRYAPSIWNNDQDLKAMRQHVTEDFEEEFRKGRDEYLLGKWSTATKHLERANEIMVENVMDQGYIEEEIDELHNRIMDGEELAEEELRNTAGDGPSQCLLNFIKGREAPDDWEGYRPLTSK